MDKVSQYTINNRKKHTLALLKNEDQCEICGDFGKEEYVGMRVMPGAPVFSGPSGTYNVMLCLECFKRRQREAEHEEQQRRNDS